MAGKPETLPPNIEAIVDILEAEDDTVYFGLASSVLQFSSLR